MKRIKTIALTLTLAFVTIIGATGVYLNVHAAVRYDGADQLFYETLNEIFDNEKADTVTVSAEKKGCMISSAMNSASRMTLHTAIKTDLRL